MPVAVNASPSPSSGGGPPRTTATSRRGGRTRSRSPPTMGRPLGGGSPFPPSSVVVLGNGGGGENPSSAAAAAAAAAKAYSNGPPPTTSGGGAGGRLPPTHSAWPESSARDDPPAAGYHNGYDKQQQHYHHHQQGPPPPHPPQSGSHNWPTGPEDAAARSSYRYQNEYPQGYTSNVRYRDDRYHHDGRYRDMPREQYYDERGQPLPPTPHHHPHHRPSRHSGPYPVDYRYSHHGRGGVRSNALNMGHRPPPQPHGGGGGTSLVIGGATPIHIPKVSLVANEHEHRGMVERTDSRTSSRQSRRGTAESVFRGRPGDAAAAPPSSAEMVDSPQKLLLSLRTPSASFEEKDGAKKSAAFAEKAGELLPENRSPEDSKHSGSIETAQSYSLFNQSFDSFGEGNIFNIDSTLQNDSFGMGRIASVDAEAATQILHATSGNFAQQLLTANSGGLTLSYSPVNSFGNVSAVANGQSRRTGTTMVVGGGDPSNPPTQELVYQSYSMNGPRAGPLDDSHLRMSVGSFGLGATSLPYSRSYGEGPPTGPSSYGYAAIRGQENADGTLVFYEFLAKYKSAFKDCEFLLPGLKSALLESPISGKEGSTNPVTIEAESTNTESAVPYGEPSPQDVALARRRVESSIFAFGGNPHSRDNVQSKGNGENSIFRGTNNDDPDKQTSATITPGSTTSTNDARHADCRAKSRYEEELPRRYYENQSRLSWEFEETPPVEISLETDESDEYAEDDPDSPHRGQTTAEGNDFRNSDEANGNISGGDQRLNSAPSSPQPKMRYRCKLCGQPKQNHTCPYQQSLARSIGVMVFPSVNAFTADEPGSLAPPLTEMNNFFDAREPGSNDSTPSRPSPDRMRSRLPPVGPVTSTTQVTPESMRSSPRSNLHSPTPSFATTPAQTPLRHTTPSRSAMSTGSRKRSYATLNGTPEATDLLFMEPMELKVDQFRVVTPSKVLNATDAFCYPSLPLPYAQRKRLSDNLYALSSEVPRLTDECALVLREAREKDMWDLAVAELMTQVIVIIHCPDGDARFDGLRQYLLTLGIAC
ncbi:hypothetical protein MPSEU_000613700 [Mayamaea pseudoterrestris]|nr:hypothetical protein MPSEU_000613700 [Mayamaea pseudoterrestris]